MCWSVQYSHCRTVVHVPLKQVGAAFTTSQTAFQEYSGGFRSRAPDGSPGVCALCVCVRVCVYCVHCVCVLCVVCV